MTQSIPQTKHISVAQGIATLEDGTTIDLLRIQAALSFAHDATGEKTFKEAAEKLSLLTEFERTNQGEFSAATTNS